MVNKGLVAIDKRTLEVAWRGSVSPGLVSQSEYAGRGLASLSTTPALVGKDLVCASNADGIIHFWNLSDGSKVREINTGVPYLGGVAVSDGVVYAADMSGTVRAFSAT